MEAKSLKLESYEPMTDCIQIEAKSGGRATSLASRGGVTAEVHLGGADLIEQLALEWRSLCDRSPSPEPFGRPEWVEAYLRAFEPEATLALVAARQNGEMIAVLPLILERTAIYGVPVRMLRSAANVHSPRFPLTHGPELSHAEAAYELWQAIRTGPHWQVIQIQNVFAGGPLESLFEAAEQDGFRTGQWQSLRSPYLPLTGWDGTGDWWFRNSSSHFRKTMRQSLRKLDGRLHLERVDVADPRALECLFSLEASGWKGQEKSAIASNESVRQFYTLLANAAARFGFLSLYFLQLEGQTIAAHFGLSYRDRYYLLKCAYDEHYKQYSPGHLIIHAVLQDCAARGLAEFDFTGPSDDWKLRWTKEGRELSYRYIFQPNLVGRALHFAKFRLNPAVKSLLQRM